MDADIILWVVIAVALIGHGYAWFRHLKDDHEAGGARRAIFGPFAELFGAKKLSPEENRKLNSAQANSLAIMALCALAFIGAVILLRSH